MQPKAPKYSRRIFIGWDAHELQACRVAEHSLYRRAMRTPIHVEHISMELVAEYKRPTTSLPNGQLFDELSDAPMSTSHAIARFWVPRLCGLQGWALFMDGDVLIRDDINKIFDLADPQYAVMVVQHPPMPESSTKKAGQLQQMYARKNWSSVVLWHCGHLANQVLTREVLNTWPGRDLHAFSWLRDDQIGALPARWNHLVGVSAPDPDAALVHYTLGTPDLPDHDQDAFADEWFKASRVAGYQPPAFHTEVAG